MPAWTFSTELARLTLARAETLNTLFSGISTGFSLTYTKAEIDAYTFVTANITNNAVTFAKMQQITDMKVIGNVSGGTANVAEVSILDEDAMTSNSATALATQQSIKAYADTKLALAGGTMSGDITMGANTVTGLAAPSAASDAATKSYVDALVAATVDAAPGALDTLNELAAALGDDASFSTTMTNALAGKLPLAGGTMTGNIDMDSKFITNLPTPTQTHHAASKSYVDGILGSATAASASAAAAATTYDNFDDRYLGQKSADPSVDNDGDALIVGALYFNNVSNIMKVWNGSSWQTTEYNSSNVDITGGSISGITDLAVADGGTGSSTAIGAANTLEVVSFGAAQSLTVAQQYQARTNIGAGFGFENRLINPLFQVDIEGNAGGVTTSGKHVVEGWAVFHSSDVTTLTASRVAGDSVPYALRMTVTTGADTSIAAGQYAAFYTAIEGYDIADAKWGTADAKSVWVCGRIKAPTTGTYCVTAKNGAEDRSYVFEVACTAGTWVDFEKEVPGDISGTWNNTNGLGLLLSFTAACGSTFQTTADTWATGNYVATANQANGLATNGNIYEIEDIRVSVGKPIKTEWRPYPLDLLQCSRYYEVIQVTANGAGDSAGWYGNVLPKVSKRATPTMAVVTNTIGSANSFSQIQQNYALASCTVVGGVHRSVVSMTSRMI